MKRTILEVYALSVCFVTLACFVVTLGIALYDIIEMSAPQLTLDPDQYQKHQSNENFIKSCDSDDKNEKALSESEITGKRERSYKRVIEVEKRNALQSFVQCLIILVINAVVFWSHWYLGKKSRSLGNGQ